MDFFKMMWMMAWRLLVLLVFAIIFFPSFMNYSDNIIWIFLAAVIIPVSALYFGAKITVHSFPIIRLISGREVLRSRKRGTEYSPPKRRKGYSATSTPSNSASRAPRGISIERATGKGRQTGYEPRFLNKVNAPYSKKMFGVPGRGLTNASHMGSGNIQAGKTGEENFAKALMITDSQGNVNYSKNNGILNNVNSYWSVSVPSDNNPNIPDHLNTDVDCVIVFGRNIFLFDMKYYKSGDVTFQNHNNELYTVDNATGKMVGKPKKMTRNMAMAYHRFKKHYPRYDVYAAVIAVPTNDGAGIIDGVLYPGNIPFLNVDEIIKIICGVAQGSSSVDSHVHNNMVSLLR